VERELIEITLQHFDGDKKQTADMLGISLKTLYNRLNSYVDA
jgi:two-component system, NtrC family, response regulator HydG